MAIIQSLVVKLGGEARQPNSGGYRIDSNCMAIRFSVLADEKEVHTGDSVTCSNEKCTAILNSVSTVKQEGEGTKVSEYA